MSSETDLCFSSDTTFAEVSLDMLPEKTKRFVVKDNEMLEQEISQLTLNKVFMYVLCFMRK